KSSAAPRRSVMTLGSVSVTISLWLMLRSIASFAFMVNSFVVLVMSLARPVPRGPSRAPGGGLLCRLNRIKVHPVAHALRRHYLVAGLLTPTRFQHHLAHRPHGERRYDSRAGYRISVHEAGGAHQGEALVGAAHTGCARAGVVGAGA